MSTAQALARRAGVSHYDVETFGDGAIGSLDVLAAEAPERERGLIGLLGRLPRFPGEARGPRDFQSELSRAVALGVGIAAEVLIVIASGVIALIEFAVT
jgi:hypothetical protein